MSTKSQPVAPTSSRQMSKTLPKHCDASSKDSARLAGSISDKAGGVIAEDLPLHDMKTLRFFYNVGINYFRSVANVPPPSVTMASPPANGTQPTFSCSPCLKTTNIIEHSTIVTPLHPSSRFAPVSRKSAAKVAVQSDRPFIAIQPQQPPTAMKPNNLPSPGSRSCGNDLPGNDLPTCQHRPTGISELSPDIAEGNAGRKATHASTVLRSCEAENSGVAIEVTALETCCANEKDASDRRGYGDLCEAEKAADVDGELALSCMHSNKRDTATSTAEKVGCCLSADAGPRSPADSGWMSDVSVRTSCNSGSSSAEGTRRGGASPSSSVSAVDGEDDDNELENSCGQDVFVNRHVTEPSSNNNVDGKMTELSTELEDQLVKFCRLDAGDGNVTKNHDGETEGQSEGEGDDEEDSLVSQPAANSEQQFKETANNGCAEAPTTLSTRQSARPMRPIPVRFQRLLEAEVERVVAVRRRVEGAPLFAAATSMLPQQSHSSGWMAMTPDAAHMLPIAFAGNDDVATGYATMALAASPLCTSAGAYQLQSNSSPMAPTSSFVFPAAATGATGIDSASAVVAQFVSPTGVFDCQPVDASSYPTATMYNSSYATPYNTCSANVPAYVVHVDGTQTMRVENQPNFRLAVTCDYRLVPPPSAAMPVTAVAGCGASIPVSCRSSYPFSSATPYDMASPVKAGYFASAQEGTCHYGSCYAVAPTPASAAKADGCDQFSHPQQEMSAAAV